MTSGFPPQHNSVVHLYARSAVRCALRLLLMLLAAGSIAAPDVSEAQPSFGAPGGPPTSPGASGPPKVTPRRRYALEETGETIHDVKVEGLQTIVPNAVFARVGSQEGKPLSPRQIREDVRKLYETDWFYNVEPRVEDTAEGPVVIFRVLERPIVQRVEFLGNKKFKDSYFEALTGLRKGSPFVVALNQEAARQIERAYKEKGYHAVQVELVKGGDKHDREVIFKITEGKKVVISGIRFTGNRDIRSGVLKTKLGTKKQILWFFGGKYDPSTISDDVTALRSYYTGLGYFDVKIEKQVEFRGDQDERVHVTFKIDEGERYRIRNVEIDGTRVLSEASLREDMKTLPGNYFLVRDLNEDITEIRRRYGKLGRINASVEAIPKFLETPGVMDLQLVIDEDEVWRIRRINVHIDGNGGRPTSHTQESVVINPMTLFPGDLADPLEIARSKARVNRQNLFEQGVRIEFNPVPEEETLARISSQPNGVIRGQMPEYGDFRMRKEIPEDLRHRDFGIPEIIRSQNSDDGEENLVRGQTVEDGILQPYNPQFENNPLGDPFGPALRNPPPPVIDYREGDLDVYVQEARTGRLMFGAGVNSDSGVVGNIVLDERNFDLFRPPTSIDDILEGRAFRGGGQSFRLEAVPGSEVSRYTISWSNPYFLDTDINLGLSGFYYQRFLDNWDERRAGGRVNFGYQFTPEFSGGVAFRLENVQISGIRAAGIVPPELLAVNGDNFLSTARMNLTYDTRDSSFMPSEGHIVTGAYEQGFGEFAYPKFDLSGSKYFTTYSRLDGQGKHILSVSGDVGWTGDDTPIFERYYAGGYSSFRGFEFRGVTPLKNGVEVGGQFQFLGSVQYQMPITADEMFSVVAFTDFGTVEPDANFDNFRVSVGGGIRLQIPAMGPVPMAFDWAVPLRRAPGDERQLFAFYVGISR